MKNLLSLAVCAAALLVVCAQAEEAKIVAPGDPVLSKQELSAIEAKATKKEFKAETEKLMGIIINSLYTERDVFLRELVSNSVDALEKARVMSLKYPKKGYKANESDLKIFIKSNKQDNQLLITDTGIGMCSDELESNLGTVAKSGTQEFMDAAKRGASASNLIGQFGVGFYSAFLVAENVTVVSKCVSQKDQYVWKSSVGGAYTIAKHPRKSDVLHGTTIILDLKGDAENYADTRNIEKILERFSQFVPFPVFLAAQKGDKEPEWHHANAQRPLWLREKSNVTEDEYNEFYKSTTKQRANPLAYTHFKTEGDLEFSSILYIPNRQERDMYFMGGDEKKGSNIKLYVQRVLISDQLEMLLPGWLSFVTGVIDSNDLPLKVDRETFTQSRVLRIIKAKVVNKVFELLRQMSKDAEKETESLNVEIEKLAELKLDSDNLYERRKELTNTFPSVKKFNRFWELFGPNMVLGCVENDPKMPKKILKIFRARPLSSPYTHISIDEYIAKMKPGQESIYYLTGDSVESMAKSPYLELFRAKDIEVLLLTGSFDEACLVAGKAYKEKTFVSIEKNVYTAGEFAYLEAGDDVKAKRKAAQDADREYEARKEFYKPLIEWIQSVVGTTRAQYVVLSKTLVKSPAMITSPEHGFTAAHERMARTSVGQNPQLIEAYSKMKNLEINPEHPLIHRLLQRVLALQADYNAAQAKELNHTIDMIYESATISSGFPPRKAHILIDALYKIIQEATVGEEELSEDFKLTIPEEVYSKVDKTRESLDNDSLDDNTEEEEDDMEDFLVRDEL